MSGFLYFKSGDQRPVTKDGIAALGLAYAFTGSIGTRPCNLGPSKKPGLVFADDKRHEGKTLGFYPDQQTWRKMPTVEGRPELWVGYWNDAKPTPADLVRADARPGEALILLGDGNQWLVPTLTEFDPETKTGECELPCLLDFDEDGALHKTTPTGKWAALWDLVHPVAVKLCFPGDGAAEPSDAEVQQAAFALLAANYVVSMVELATLGALRADETFERIVMVSCRGRWLIQAIDALSKKNNLPAVNTSATSAGDAA